MSKQTPNYADAATQIARQEKAINQARAFLKEKGIEYPIYDPKLSMEQNYATLLSFSEQEAALVVQYMRMPSGDRPLVLDTTGKKEWKGYND